MEAKGRVESDSDGTPVRALGIDRDITERKRREQELEETPSASKSSPHRQPRPQEPAICRRGTHRTGPQEYDSEHLDSASDALARMRTLIDDLLAAARDEQSAVDTGVVPLSDAAEQCWHTSKPTRPNSLSRRTPSSCRQEPFEQLLENLFSNSVEHGSTSSRPEADDSVEHGGNDVTVTPAILTTAHVEDNGEGIDEEDRSRAFETGYSTSDAGTGFGLWIVAEIADAHDWTVTIGERARAAHGTKVPVSICRVRECRTATSE